MSGAPMTEVRFYHMQRTTLEAVLAPMLQRTLERGQRALVLAGSPERVEALTAHLWTYADRSFLPHGNARDGRAERQPIWLAVEDENPNQAEVLFLTDGAVSARIGEFTTCAELFDGRDAAAVAAARERWRAYRSAGHSVIYFQQSEQGRWEEKQTG